MAINLLELKPTTISRDMKGKYICIYSLPKGGKTTFASQFPKSLLIAFEKGYNFIPGIYAADVDTWGTFKQFVAQLDKPDMKEKYSTIIIDTVAIAWALCEDYVCSQHRVSKISDIAWGAGYAAHFREFDTTLRRIAMLGYGIVFIAHVDKRSETRADGSEIEILAPAIPKRCYASVNQIVDIIAYLDITWDAEGKSERWLYTRKTPTIMAGSRLKYIEEKIKFGYDELVEAMNKAIEKEIANGAKVTDVQENPLEDPAMNLAFEELREKAKDIWSRLIVQDDNNHNIIKAKIAEIFGSPIKLSEITEEQIDLFRLITAEMELLLKPEN